MLLCRVGCRNFAAKGHSKTSQGIIQSGDLFKSKIASIPSISLNEKIKLLQMLSLRFKTLGPTQNNFSCCLVMYRFQSYSKRN